MLVFLDTEFTELDESAQLLSIGLVCELDDRMRFYREIAGVSLDGCSEYAKELAVPQLIGADAAKAFEQVATELYAWLSELHSSTPIELACDWSGDWAWAMLLLSVAHEHGAPAPLPPNVLGPPHLIWEAICTPEALRFEEAWRLKHGLRQHHALNDALANRATYLHFQSRSPAK